MPPSLLGSDPRCSSSHRPREVTGISLSIVDTSVRLRNRRVLLPRLLQCLEAVPCCTASDISHRLPKDASSLSLQLSQWFGFLHMPACVSPHHTPSKQESSREAFHWTCVCTDPPESTRICRAWPRTASLIHDRIRGSRRSGTWWHKRIAARRTIIWPRLHLRCLNHRTPLPHPHPTPQPVPSANGTSLPPPACTSAKGDVWVNIILRAKANDVFLNIQAHTCQGPLRRRFAVTLHVGLPKKWYVFGVWSKVTCRFFA